MAEDTVRHSISSLDIDSTDPPVLSGFDAVVPDDFATPGLAITDVSAPVRIFVKNGTFDDTATGTALGTIVVTPAQADGFELVGESKTGVIWRHDTLSVNPAGGPAVYTIRNMQMGNTATDNSRISCVNAARGSLLLNLIFNINTGVNAVQFDASSVGYKCDALGVGVDEPSTLLLMDGLDGMAINCAWFGTNDLTVAAFIVQGQGHSFLCNRVNAFGSLSNKYGLRLEGSEHRVLWNRFRISTEAFMIRTQTSLDNTVIAENQFFTGNDEASPTVDNHACVFLDAVTEGLTIRGNICEIGFNGAFGNFLLFSQVNHRELTVEGNVFGHNGFGFGNGAAFIRRTAVAGTSTMVHVNILRNLIQAGVGLNVFEMTSAVTFALLTNWMIRDNSHISGGIVGNDGIGSLTVADNAGSATSLSPFSISSGGGLARLVVTGNDLSGGANPALEILLTGSTTSGDWVIADNCLVSTADTLVLDLNDGSTLARINISGNTIIAVTNGCLVQSSGGPTTGTTLTELNFSDNTVDAAANALSVALNRAADAWDRVVVSSNVCGAMSTAVATKTGAGTLTGVADGNVAPGGTTQTSGAGWTAGTNFNI